MFKVMSSELKKMLSKPGIYVLSIFLAIILILGVVIYQPDDAKQKVSNISASTCVEVFDKYQDEKTNNYDIKLNNALSSISAYKIADGDSYISKKTQINKLKSEFYESVDEYKRYSKASVVTPALLQELKTDIATKLDNLKSTITSSLASGNENYIMLSTETNRENFYSICDEIKAHFNQTVAVAGIGAHCDKFVETYKPTLENCLNSFVYPNLSFATIDDYTVDSTGSKYASLKQKLEECDAEINNLHSLALADATGQTNRDKSKLMAKFANEYCNTIETYCQLIKYKLMSNAFDKTPTNTQLSIKTLKGESKFNANSLFQKFSYMFEHNKTINDYANPLTIGVISNGSQQNAFDYSYFVLRVFSFVIIVFAIISAVYTIAGEVKEGTMRYFAIRPVSRTSIFFGKMLAIFVLSLILATFSAIISLAVGGAVYGFKTANILTIFNGNSVIIIHPIVMVLLYLLSMMLELIVYLSLAMLISCLLKSDLMGATLLIVFYTLNTLLPLFVQGSNTWLTYYLFSHINFYAMFGSSIYANTSNFFNLIFGAKVYASSSLAITLMLLLSLPVIFTYIAIKVFKKKEL